MGGTER